MKRLQLALAASPPYLAEGAGSKATGWQFDFLLENRQRGGYPGSGTQRRRYFRLTASASAENTARAVERMRKVLGDPNHFLRKLG